MNVENQYMTQQTALFNREPKKAERLELGTWNFEPMNIENQSSIPVPPAPGFTPAPGETPRAFSAFAAYFEMGHTRTLQAVAEQLGEGLPTVKNWSSKYQWNTRLQAFESGLLQQQAEARAAVRREETADWSRRTRELREMEWGTAQKVLAAAQCFLDSFGDREVQNMSLPGVSRALQIASRIARQSLHEETAPEDSRALSPLQIELDAALKRIYGKPAAPVQPAQPSTLPT